MRLVLVTAEKPFQHFRILDLNFDRNNVPLDTLHMSFRGRFYGPHDPTNSIIALKDNG